MNQLRDCFFGYFTMLLQWNYCMGTQFKKICTVTVYLQKKAVRCTENLKQTDSCQVSFASLKTLYNPCMYKK
jgi:hypothetical protein